MASKSLRSLDGSQVALAICAAGLDGCALYVLAWLVQRMLALFVPADWPLPPALLVGLEMAAWLVGLQLLRSALSERSIQTAAMGTGVLVTGLAAVLVQQVREPGQWDRLLGSAFWPTILSLLLGLLLWGRGVARSVQPIRFQNIYVAFRTGLVVIVLTASLLLFVRPADRAQSESVLGGLIVWFFLCGLVGMALANLQTNSTGGPSGQNGEPARPMPQWGVVLAASVGIVLLIGSAGASGGLARVVEPIQQGIGAVISVVAFCLYWVLYELAWLLSNLIINPLTILFQSVAGERATLPVSPLARFTPPDLGRPGAPVVVDAPFQWLAALLLLVVLLAVGGQVLRRQHRVEDKDTDGIERVQLGSWNLLWQQLLAWLRHRLGRDTPPDAASADAPGPPERAPARPEVISIRRIYAALQTQAAAAGHPRRAAQTPNEFLTDLQRHFPQAAPDLATLTRLYGEARYGPPPLPATATSEAQGSWQRIQPLIQGEAAASESRTVEQR